MPKRERWQIVAGFALLGLAVAGAWYAYWAFYDYSKPENSLRFVLSRVCIRAKTKRIKIVALLHTVRFCVRKYLCLASTQNGILEVMMHFEVSDFTAWQGFTIGQACKPKRYSFLAGCQGDAG